MNIQLKKLATGVLITLFIAACSDINVPTPTEVPNATFTPESEVEVPISEGSLEAELEVSSMTPDGQDILDPDEVACLYLDADYRGTYSWCIRDFEPDGPSGLVFEEAIIDESTFPFNDLASSVQVAPGYTLEMYSDANFGGYKWTTSESINYLGLLINPGGDTNFAGDNFNDQLSSYRVIRE